jgi:uncharacterized protein YbgA (DUF1722 family)/uncharacterized protein YbbK (DUF523 family)
MSKISVGISSCLLGEEVRFNGGHKHSAICSKELGRYFQFKPICPEVGIGLGVPRKPIRLVGDPMQPRAVGVDNPNIDVTEKLKEYGEKALPHLTNICGYIFTKGSPSCGVFRVKVYKENGMPNENPGSGIFASVIMNNNPLLPVEEAGRLTDPVLKENFIQRVFAYHDWQQLKKGRLNINKLMDFHSRYKYSLMSHSPDLCVKLGRMLAKGHASKIEKLGNEYFTLFMETLTRKATRKTNTNVLMHLQGYLKTKLDRKETESLGKVVEQYRLGILPIIVPVTLIKSFFHSHPNSYAEKQVFLHPYPEDLSLRNSI